MSLRAIQDKPRMESLRATLQSMLRNRKLGSCEQIFPSIQPDLHNTLCSNPPISLSCDLLIPDPQNAAVTIKLTTASAGRYNRQASLFPCVTQCIRTQCAEVAIAAPALPPPTLPYPHP